MPIKPTILILSSIAIFGCNNAKLKDVSFTDSVNGQPCAYRGEDEGEITANDHEDDVAGLKKEAELKKANTVLMKGTKNKGPGLVTFFECKEGLPLYWSDGIWFAKSLQEPKTKSDFSKAWTLCKYESHKATVDTSHKPSTRPLFIEPTGFSTGNSFYDFANSANAFGNTMSQIHAIEQDERNVAEHDARLTEDRRTLLSECLEINGFSTYRSTTHSAEKTFMDNCPKQDNRKIPCFLESQH